MSEDIVQALASGQSRNFTAATVSWKKITTKKTKLFFKKTFSFFSI